MRKSVSAVGVLSALILVVSVFVSCSRPLGIPVGASVNTATPTQQAITSTQTSTSTNTPLGNTATCTNTSTVTNTQTSTSTVTPLGNTYTATATQTVTNTDTPAPPTATQTSTNTAGNTNTATATCTMTNTVPPAPTNTPVCAVTPWNDFDEGGWTGTVPFTPAGYLTNGYVTAGDTQTIKVNTDPSTPAGGVTPPQGLELSGNFVTAGDVTEIVTENGANYGTDQDFSSVAGSTMVLSLMVYSATNPVTVANAFIWDSSNHSTYTGVNGVVPAGVWTNVVIPIGTHLQAGVADTAPWSNAAGTGMNFTDTHAIGFDFTSVAGAYDFFIDDIYLMCQ